MKKIVVIGAGVIGCSVARELSRYRAEVLVLEAGNDVAVGASKANSGIVHGGFDAKTGSLKAKYNVRGNAMFDEISKQLDFPFKRNGSVVLCFDEGDLPALKKLYDRGIANGVENMQIVYGNDEIAKIEPFVSDKAVAALVVPSGGIVSPYEMTIAYAENASLNGVVFEFNKRVVGVSSCANGYCVSCADGSFYECDALVNCAGVHCDEINNAVGSVKLKVIPRKGDYELLDKNCANLASHTLFQLPTAMGKGVLVTPTVHGNILVGPTATEVDDKDDVDTTAEDLAEVVVKARLTIPSLPTRSIITQFSGVRAHVEQDDFIIGERSDAPMFFNACGIESPGLTSAPAIAVDLSAQVATKLSLDEKENFNPNRKAIPHFASLSAEERQKLIDGDSSFGKVVCRCEVVTEGEIIQSIRRTPGARDLDGVKRRTRAGMGRCQAGFCTTRIMEILARELNISLNEVTKRGEGSNVVKGRTK